MSKSRIAERIKTPAMLESELQDVITKNIKHLMIDRGYNQKTLESLTGIRQGNISKRFNKDLHYSLYDIVLFAKALNVSVIDLLTPKEKAPNGKESRWGLLRI